MLKLKFAFAFLVLLFIWSPIHAQSNNVADAQDSLVQQLIGKWRLHAVDERNEFGGPPSEDSLQKRRDDNEAYNAIYGDTIEKDYTAYWHRMYFNSAGEFLDNTGKYGFLYAITDSTLTLGTRVYRLLELSDSNLIIIDKDPLWSSYGLFKRRIYRRVSRLDSANSRLEINELMKGQWFLEEVKMVEMEETRGFLNYKVKIVDTLAQSEADFLILNIDADSLQVKNTFRDTIFKFKYEAVDRQILRDGDCEFIIQEISDERMLLLGPFLPISKNTQILIFRKEEA